jgi:hypothetical protein
MHFSPGPTDKHLRGQAHRSAARMSRRAAIEASVLALVLAGTHLPLAPLGIPKPVGASQITDGDIVYPAASGIVNVREHGVAGDGVTDDTAAIQALIQSTPRHGGRPDVTLYFPAGIYLVSDTIEWMNPDGTYMGQLCIYGAGLDRTIFRLQDNLPSFADTSAPRAVLYTASMMWEGNKPNTVGDGNAAYQNHLLDFTVDTGSGNPGAIGISWLANNRGSLHNVRVMSGDGQGLRGIDLTRDFGGPALLRNVTVEGFDVGIDAGAHPYGRTLENITVTDQIVAGIRSNRQPLTIRNLHSVNSVPAIVLTPDEWNFLTVIDALLEGTGEASTRTAIEIGLGHSLLRNVVTTGYAAALNDRGTLVHEADISEYISTGPYELFPTEGKTLDLPVMETPETFYSPEMSDWANVVDFGATPLAFGADDQDDGPAIQAAIDSGAPIIYFPKGFYQIRSTVYIRGNVQAIYGFNSYLQPTLDGGDFTDPNIPTPLLEFTGGTAGTVTITDLEVRNRDSPVPVNIVGLVHAAPDSTLVVKRSMISGTSVDYLNRPGAGDFFIEDAAISVMHIIGQRVWARQLNAELEASIKAPFKVENNGGTIWILGMKTEHHLGLVRTTGGGHTELFGGAFWPNPPLIQPEEVAFVVDESHVSLNFFTGIEYQQRDYDIVVQETRNGEIRILTKGDAPTRVHGIAMPLYCGGDG